MKDATIGVLKRNWLFLDLARNDVIIHWKQGSFLGIGGNREQTYTVGEYKYRNDYRNIVVYFQKDFGTLPERIQIGSQYQYGTVNGILFLVNHDKRQYPFQERFCGSCDVSYNSGEYLIDV